MGSQIRIESKIKYYNELIQLKKTKKAVNEIFRMSCLVKNEKKKQFNSLLFNNAYL